MDSAIQKADQKMQQVLSDPEARRMYDLRAQSLSDYNSAINSAERKGRQEGRQERNIELAKRLLFRGHPIEEIAEDTDLDIATIEKLKSEIH